MSKKVSTWPHGFGWQRLPEVEPEPKPEVEPPPTPRLPIDWPGLVFADLNQLKC